MRKVRKSSIVGLVLALSATLSLAPLSVSTASADAFSAPVSKACGTQFVFLTIKVTTPGARVGYSPYFSSVGESTYWQFNSNGTFGVSPGFHSGWYEIWASPGHVSQIAATCVKFG